MIIRIGDERRQQKDDHIKKLKAMILQDETLKNHRALVTDILLKCVMNMPHKIALYAAIVGSVAVDNEQLATEIVTRVGELLQESLVQ
jgi:hypothetical protein